jgi:hypothetical protein
VFKVRLNNIIPFQVDIAPNLIAPDEIQATVYKDTPYPTVKAALILIASNIAENTYKTFL